MQLFIVPPSPSSKPVVFVPEDSSTSFTDSATSSLDGEGAVDCMDMVNRFNAAVKSAPSKSFVPPAAAASSSSFSKDPAAATATTPKDMKASLDMAATAAAVAAEFNEPPCSEERPLSLSVIPAAAEVTVTLPCRKPISSYLSTGTFAETYTIGKELGEGAFGMVREVTHQTTREQYAVKVINTKQMNKKQVSRLSTEIQVMHEVKGHPNIVTLHDVFLEKTSNSSAPVYCLVMEKLEGGELFDRIVRKECYTESDARDACFFLLSAMQHCHRRRIVHRDLKPENLLLVSRTCDSQMKLVDFGFAKIVLTPNSLRTRCGSPAYVAPEILDDQCRSNAEGGGCGGYDIQVDMWSIGVILYILLCGYLPFDDSGDVLDLYEAILDGDYDFDDDHWEQCVSRDAKDLITGLLEVDPVKRITAEQALQSNWITSTPCKLRRQSLVTSLDVLRQFNVKRKWKKIFNTVQATRKFTVFGRSVSRSSSESSMDSASSTEPSPPNQRRPLTSQSHH